MKNKAHERDLKMNEDFNDQKLVYSYVRNRAICIESEMSLLIVSQPTFQTIYENDKRQ